MDTKQDKQDKPDPLQRTLHQYLHPLPVPYGQYLLAQPAQPQPPSVSSAAEEQARMAACDIKVGSAVAAVAAVRHLPAIPVFTAGDATPLAGSQTPKPTMWTSGKHVIPVAQQTPTQRRAALQAAIAAGLVSASAAASRTNSPRSNRPVKHDFADPYFAQGPPMALSNVIVNNHSGVVESVVDYADRTFSPFPTGF